jgi:hypothetical protein
MSVAKEATTALVQPELKGLGQGTEFSMWIDHIADRLMELCHNSHNYRSCGMVYQWSVIQKTDPWAPVFQINRIERDGRRVTKATLRLTKDWRYWTNENAAPLIFHHALNDVRIDDPKLGSRLAILAEAAEAPPDPRLADVERLKSERADLADKLAKAEHENTRLRAIITTARRRWGDYLRLAQEAMPADVGARAS